MKKAILIFAASLFLGYTPTPQASPKKVLSVPRDKTIVDLPSKAKDLNDSLNSLKRAL